MWGCARRAGEHCPPEPDGSGGPAVGAVDRAVWYAAAAPKNSSCQPATRESGTTQSAADIAAPPHQLPNQPRAIILDHYDEAALVESKITLGDPAGQAAARQCRIETARQSRLPDHLGIARTKMVQRRQGKLGRERQRRECRAWADGAVIGPVGHAACGIAEKTAFPAVDLQRLEAGPVIRRDAPTILAIACEPVRIAPCVFALDISGTPAVFEIVAVFLAHESISYAGEIDPGLGKMMDEERPGIKKLVIVDVLPLIGRGPRPEAVVRQGVCRRRQAQNIENDRFVIAIPAIVQKAAIRLPSLPRGRCAAAGPLPIDAAVDRIGAFANLVFAWRVLAEILARSQHPREQQRGVDQRHLDCQT